MTSIPANKAPGFNDSLVKNIATNKVAISTSFNASPK